MAGPSKSQVNKAGKILRGLMPHERVVGDRARDALSVVREHRAAHRLPLTKATMGLRSVVQTEGCKVEVSQRLKRIPTIIDKLAREPTMQLSSMQDIGGCRAVLDTIDEVRRVQRRLSKNRPPLRVYDYIAEPRPSGYRGVHVVVGYDERPVEVQLRTQAMHDWAFGVERLGGRLGRDLKSGSGPTAVLGWLENISEAMAIEEGGGVVDGTRLDRLKSSRLAALPYLEGGQR